MVSVMVMLLRSLIPCLMVYSDVIKIFNSLFDDICYSDVTKTF